MKYNEPERWAQLKVQKQERLNQMDFLEMGGLKQKLGNREVRIWYKVHDEQVSESVSYTHLTLPTT